jgi:ribonuclease-3
MEFNNAIKKIENKIGYTFKDKSLLRQAFTRTSFCNENKTVPYQSNEVLEFIGDSVLSTSIVTLLMKELSKRYEYGLSTKLGEGDFSNIKSKLSDKKNLSRATESLGLSEFLLMGEGDSKLGIDKEASVMEDLFESIIGAIYIDSGCSVEAVLPSVKKMLNVKDYVTESAPPIQSYKNALQEWCADKKRKLPAPTYKTISESGPDHKKIYERACYIGDKLLGTGKAKNQKLADMIAAEAALNALKVEEEKNNRQKNELDASATLTLLREIASKNKVRGPEFRDLGEEKDEKSGADIFEIEARLLGFSAKGRAQSKKDAKALAAKKLLETIKSSRKKKK